MKTLLNRIALAILITSLASVAVFAKAKKETLTLTAPIKVNGTLVNKGVYDLKFDDKTGELSIEKNNKVIARAATSVAKRDQKANKFELRLSGSKDDRQLTGVTFAGTDQDIVISGTQASR